MRKRIYILAAAAAMAVLAACGPKGSGEGKGETAVEQTTEAAESTGAQDSSEAAGSEAVPGESGTGSTDGSFPAIGEKETGLEETENVPADEKLSQAYKAVKEAYGENYIPDMAYDETALSEIFGVKKDWYDTFVADGPAISVHVETFIGIKAKEGKAEDVAKALEDYKAGQLASSAQYPMNLVKFQAAEIASHGDYVFFVMLGSPSMEAEEEGEEAALASARENNAVALDAIEACFKE